MINTTSKRLIALRNQIAYKNSFIKWEGGNAFGKLILSRPKALNSLNLEMVKNVG